MNPQFKFAPFEQCQVTGYCDNILNEATGVPMEKWNKAPEVRLNYITMWLYIITDNFLHLTINYFALKYL